MKNAANDPLYLHPQLMDVSNHIQDGEVRDVYLKNLDYGDMGYVSSIELAEQQERENVQAGQLVKVVVSWPIDGAYQERIWVEVTKVGLDFFGSKTYWGRLYTNSQVGNYGDLIGPIKPHNVLAIEPSYFANCALAA
jgi:hypothetical protein